MPEQQETRQEVILYDDLTPEQKALVDSEDYDVRLDAVRAGFGLDKLTNDEYSLVRAAVARQGYALDELKNDEEDYVRWSVAHQGYALDELKNDESWNVRREVAYQGYALDELANDPNDRVRRTVEDRLEEEGLTLEQWITRYPERCGLSENRPEAEMSTAMPEQQKTKPEVILYDDLTRRQRAQVNSWRYNVRHAAAMQGLGLDRLKEDRDWHVRAEVARQGYALDYLKYDGQPDVRIEVARQGYALDELKDDEHWIVREAVARQGYALDQLQYDLDPSVSIEVRNYLEDRNLTIEQWIERYPERCGLPENRPEIILYDDLKPEQKAMVDSEYIGIRIEAAQEGFGLDKLKNDAIWNVRRVVAEQGYALDELKNDVDYSVREAVASQGYALDELKGDESWSVRLAVARQGYALDELKDDEDWTVRVAVASQGYALDELKGDESWSVRAQVAEQGYALDELKDHWHYQVRAAVAEQGYALDELKDDEHWRVRLAVARQGYALDELKSDPDDDVREEVARQGYALDELAGDPNDGVRWAVENYLEEEGLTLEQWVTRYPERCGLPENRPEAERSTAMPEQQETRPEVILYDDLTPEQKAMVDSEDLQDRDIAAEQGLGLDKLKDDYSLWVRARVAENGYALDELKDDEHGFVRVEVARQGYALDELKSDPDPEVRLAVAVQGYALDELKNDEDWGVRAQVAEQGYALDELKDDEHWIVREAVARQGYALDQLQYDLDPSVSIEVRNYLEDRNLTIEQWIERYPERCGLPENRADTRPEVILYDDLTPEQKAMVDSEDLQDRDIAAEQGLGLDKLKNDPDWVVRKSVAEQGYALDELKSDRDNEVRLEVARQGYALDELKSDPHPDVRKEVARQGYALDELKNDEDELVRARVADQGYALDELKNDREMIVRSAVARQGYALDELASDLEYYVRQTVEDRLEEEGLTLEQWITRYPERCGLPENRADARPEIILYDDLTPEQKALVDSKEIDVRYDAAGAGFGLDKLKNDEDVFVRAAVAEQGYALDELKDDPDMHVRAAVARQGYALDELKADPDEDVRATVARQDYALDELKDDPDWRVRRTVARQGYALDELKGDDRYEVRATAVRSLESQGLTLEQWIEQYPERCGLPENRADTRPEVILYDDLTRRQKAQVDSLDVGDRRIAATRGLGLDKLKDDESYEVRLEVAIKGYALDELKDDPVSLIRATVAHQGYALDELKNDENELVRASVAGRGYALDELKLDESWRVRAEVAREGYALNNLKDDESWLVREVVAGQGYALDKLNNDQASEVRVEVGQYLVDRNLTLEQWIEQNPDRCGLPENRPNAERGEIMPNGTEPTVKVCLGNYGGYNAGVLVDRWVDLPMSPQDLDAVMADMRREAEQAAGTPCEEFYISDFDRGDKPRDGLFNENTFNEFTPVGTLNQMAALISTMDERELQAASAYIGHQGSNVSMVEAMNVLLQAEDVPYYDYDWPEYTGSDPVYQAIHDSATPEKKYGYLCVESDPKLKELLENDSIADNAFDYEAYGKQSAEMDGVKLFDDGYLANGEVDMGHYSMQEIEAEVIGRLESARPELAKAFENDMAKKYGTLNHREAERVQSAAAVANPQKPSLGQDIKAATQTAKTQVLNQDMLPKHVQGMAI